MHPQCRLNVGLTVGTRGFTSPDAHPGETPEHTPPRVPIDFTRDPRRRNQEKARFFFSLPRHNIRRHRAILFWLNCSKSSILSSSAKKEAGQLPPAKAWGTCEVHQTAITDWDSSGPNALLGLFLVSLRVATHRSPLATGSPTAFLLSQYAARALL